MQQTVFYLNPIFMARQTGVITLKGTIGSISFYKSRDGHMAREKGGVDGTRIATDPAFQRTRENGAEFGRAGRGSKILRDALRVIIQNAKDRRVVSRLTTEMVKVLQSDTLNVRGERNVANGDLAMLQGFEFNVNAPLGTTLYAPFTATVDRIAGTCIVNLPAFLPANLVAAPSGATHFKIVSAGAEVDFVGETFKAETKDSEILPWDPTLTPVINLSNALSANSTLPVFLLLGIQFYQEVNNVQYALKNGAFNSLQIVKVDAA
jgi:hypothetical protein